ncbi:MAG: hypothetical protein EXR00_02560 [Alphaproteobacteria bacterium]|nr:hypothetical protein [Alphaproteobacteria bacterium]
MKPARLLALATIASLASTGASLAQSHPEYVPLGRIQAALYKPDSGPAPHIAYLIAHRTANQLSTLACTELASRGFLVVCFNTRFVNNETIVNWEETPLDVKAAVDFARAQPGITKVVLLGHSGGSPLMSFYQAIAENGAAYCQKPERMMKCGNIPALTPADGLVFPDAHPGNPAQALRGINPSLSVVDGKIVVDSTLDPFSAANGYNPKGPSKYSKDFQTRYYAAQSRAMNAQIAKVMEAKARMAKGEYTYPDNDIVLVPFSDQEGSAGLMLMDPSIPEFMSTAKPQKLLKNDGSIVRQIVHSVAVPELGQAESNREFNAGTKVLTFTSYLSANATRSTNSVDGIDHCSTNISTICNLRTVKAPILVAAMGGWRFVRDQEQMYEESPAADKDFIVVEGAIHPYTPCRPCEKTPGQYSNTVKNLFDYMAAWTNKRF